jgi:hypothetical protein
MLISRDITGQRFAPGPFVAAPFETVSVFCIKDTFDPNHISRVTSRLVTLSDVQSTSAGGFPSFVSVPVPRTGRCTRRLRC